MGDVLKSCAPGCDLFFLLSAYATWERCLIMDPPMTPPEMIRRLTDAFTVNGVIGGLLQGVHEDEEHAGNRLVEQFRGQHVLMDSFLAFFVETLGLVRHDVAVNGWPKDTKNYAVAWAYYSNLFRRFRACEILSMKGYPLDAYSLMRDIKDRAFLLAGVAHGITTFPTIIGAPEISSPTDRNEYGKKGTKLRRDVEQTVTHFLIGKHSGLSPNIRQELALWDGLFHHEVHGGTISLTTELATLARGEAPNTGPTIDPVSIALYMNRSAEIGWFLLRLLPYLQVAENSFGNEWHAKDAILDESFRFMLELLGTLGKSIGDALIVLVDEKFTFRPPLHYREVGGAAPLPDCPL